MDDDFKSVDEGMIPHTHQPTKTIKVTGIEEAISYRAEPRVLSGKKIDYRLEKSPDIYTFEWPRAA